MQEPESYVATGADASVETRSTTREEASFCVSDSDTQKVPLNGGLAPTGKVVVNI